jgi:hypothetical protein
MILRMLRRGLAIGALWSGLLGTGSGAFAAGPEGASLSSVHLGLKLDASEIRIASADRSGAGTIVGGGLGDGPLPCLSSPGAAFLSPTWRPGPGREAGPIACG